MRREIAFTDMPGLYQLADKASIHAQRKYFWFLRFYLILLVVAAAISFAMPNGVVGAIISASLFLATLGILVFLRIRRPDDTWYNGRAVAESVKTRTWRWMMRAEPYESNESDELVSRQFMSDMRAILSQNQSLSVTYASDDALHAPISQFMRSVRALSVVDRLSVYVNQRVQDQVEWYWKGSRLNVRSARQWFWISVALHAAAIGLLLFRIYQPQTSLPIEVISTAAGAALTWLQARKHNELGSAYSLAAHEIMLIKEESTIVVDEKHLSEYVVSSEAAFSREHTQWIARKAN